MKYNVKRFNLYKTKQHDYFYTTDVSATHKIDAAALLQLPKHKQLANALLDNGEFHIYDVSVGLPVSAYDRIPFP